MESKMLLSLVATTVVLFIFASAAFGQECFGDIQGLPPNEGVTFSQVSYLFSGSDGQPSGTGQIDINIPKLTAYTGMNSGYINVVDDAGWVVQNLPVLSGFPYPDMSTTFNLNVGHGTLVTDLEAYVCYSPDAVPQAPRYNNPLDYSDFPVAEVGYDADLTSEPAPPPIGFTFPGGQTYFSCQDSYQNVQAANNQCAPAAVANGLSWLLGGAVDPNTPGLRDTTAAPTLVGSLDMAMNSLKGPFVLPPPCIENGIAGRWADLAGKNGLFGDIEGRKSGMPVAAYWGLRGYMDYLSAKGVMGLTLKHQGYAPSCDGTVFDGGVNFAFAGLTSLGQGQTVQPDFLYNEISAGRAVEWGWSGSAGGHAEEVICAGRILGLPFVARVSDHLQTDQDPADNQGTEFIDFSFLVPSTSGQPVLTGGLGSGAVVTTVLTQGP